MCTYVVHLVVWCLQRMDLLALAALALKSLAWNVSALLFGEEQMLCSECRSTDKEETLLKVNLTPAIDGDKSVFWFAAFGSLHARGASAIICAV